MVIAEKYRRIGLAPASELDATADVAVAALNSRFNPEDFYVIRSNDELEVWLRQVNLGDLSAAVTSVSGQYGNAGAMFQILRAVEGIRSYGVNGNKRLYVGYNSERKVVGRKQKELRRGKHYYANDHGFTKPGNLLPAEFTDQIVCGDSEAVLKQLPDNCVDLVFTSPPYNFGLGYQEPDGTANGDATDWESYFAKLFAVFDECIRVLKFGGRIVVNVQPLFSDYIPSHHIISNFFMGRRLIWKGEILWKKTTTTASTLHGAAGKAHPVPISNTLGNLWKFSARET